MSKYKICVPSEEHCEECELTLHQCRDRHRAAVRHMGNVLSRCARMVTALGDMLDLAPDDTAGPWMVKPVIGEVLTALDIITEAEGKMLVEAPAVKVAELWRRLAEDEIPDSPTEAQIDSRNPSDALAALERVARQREAAVEHTTV
jgi:hypothetical protein